MIREAVTEVATSVALRPRVLVVAVGLVLFATQGVAAEAVSPEVVVSDIGEVSTSELGYANRGPSEP